MGSRLYDIAPGSVDRSGRASPPKNYPFAPPQPAYSSPYSDRDVSPLAEYGFAAPGAANGLPQDGGSQALRDIDSLYNPRRRSSSSEPYGSPSPMMPPFQQQHSQSSLIPLTANQAIDHYPPPPRNPARTAQSGASTMSAGTGALGYAAADFDSRMPRASYYHADGYEDVDPRSIADDGDDGFEDVSRSRNGHGSAAAGSGVGMLKAFGGSDAAGNYGPVGTDPEKSAWLSKQSTGSKRMKWIVGIVIAIIVIGGVVGGVVGGLMSKKSSNKSGSSGSSSDSSGDSNSNGLWDLNSNQIKAVMNNDNLHKVFPAMDYTPNYAQYPQCLSPGGGPIQNNVTVDVAIMSQLTPAIRLYGTDCNQTELVLEAIKLLKMEDTMKVWLGVYLDGNSTTNTRQLAQLYNILDNYSQDIFAGVIVGNEVLFSKYMSESQLQQQITNVRNNLTSKGFNLPVSTADLGDNWTADLASASDIVMSNIHPFFAGTVASEAAGWTYSFWTNKDQPLTTSTTGTVGNITYPKQIISETGWPSEGGNDCGDASSPDYGCTGTTDGAVANIENLNTYMSTFVCQALNNGTTFFWFEAFDEPWKHQFDTAHDHWEPYWGLFDSNRNLKQGVNIPDCGGKTVDKPY